MNNSVVLDLQAFQRGYINALVDDIPDEKMCEPPGAIVNHPAWQLGHLCWTLDRCIQTLGGTPKLDAAWTKRYERESIPTPDRASYHGKAELLRVLDQQRAEFARLFKAVDANDLARPHPDPKLAKRFANIGMLLVFVSTTHEGTHLGQISAWRNAMGMERAMSKTEAMNPRS
jgi:uncharacterized damage-inducible protein DinB